MSPALIGWSTFRPLVEVLHVSGILSSGRIASNGRCDIAQQGPPHATPRDRAATGSGDPFDGLSIARNVGEVNPLNLKVW